MMWKLPVQLYNPNNAVSLVRMQAFSIIVKVEKEKPSMQPTVCTCRAAWNCEILWILAEAQNTSVGVYDLEIHVQTCQ